MNKRLIVTLVLAGIFIVTGGLIVYNGRPVMKMTNDTNTVTETSTNTQINVATTNNEATKATSTEQAKTEGRAPIIAPVATSTAPTPTPEPTSKPAPTQAPGTYTMAQVQSHNSASNCWTTIGGDVYDLTSWVSRHPGGENPILKLCGIDGTSNFQRKHGSSKNAQSALILLKIGTLAK